MYSDKENINILTALLRQYGVSQAVVCPGSRNAPIVHNLSEIGLRTVSVTDERCAGFYAMGMAVASLQPVAVCVTSGTALLNLGPAIAEAYYQYVPLIVISADHPSHRINQLDEQTIPQEGVFERFTVSSVSLPEPHDKASRNYCNRLVNEAITAMKKYSRPVHINVPISEPLFNFSVETLPIERMIAIEGNSSCADEACADEICRKILSARRPLVVLGYSYKLKNASDLIAVLKGKVAVVNSGGWGGFSDSAMDSIDMAGESAYPDFILHIGGSIVSKRLKRFLSSVPGAKSLVVSEDGDIHDIYGNVECVCQAAPDAIIDILATRNFDAVGTQSRTYSQLWSDVLHADLQSHISDVKHFCAEYIVRKFESFLNSNVSEGVAVHYANSLVVRFANLFAGGHRFVNRGVNGIEGSLSAAAGHSLVSESNVFCVIGDLSFFYDSNALWNNELGGNFRILLINNGGGGIFNRVKGIDRCNNFDSCVRGCHNFSAKGVCESFEVEYRSVSSMEDLDPLIEWLFSAPGCRPKLLECFV